MKLYIRATGNISPQNSFGHPVLDGEAVSHIGNRLNCIEPDYKPFIDQKLIRRMSRVIRMGVAAAVECLRQAGVGSPAAIVTGTAYGCLEDTGTFLSKMIAQDEQLLAPTAFIQSTHNTVAAQIALMVQCKGYNNVFVHRGISFEHALLDSTLLLREGEAGNVLVGGIDEITDTSHAILNRFGLYRREPVSNLQLFNPVSKGTIAGEGAAFFLLANERSENDYATFDGVHVFYRPGSLGEIEVQIAAFLSAQSISLADIDLLITGRNGDSRNDGLYDQLKGSVFSKLNEAPYKHLCGEYPTSVAFALWLAASIVRLSRVPGILAGMAPIDKPVRKILIYNHFQNRHHSLMLVSAC